MPTVKKSMIAESEFMSGEISFVDDIELKRFKREAETILDDVNSLRTSKERQIKHWFAKLIDNTSQQILDMPVSQCIADYLRAAEADKENNEEQIVDQSLSDGNAPPPSEPASAATKPADSNLTNLDYENEIEMTEKFVGYENLTSTVKKTTNKMDILKKKFESGLNEQSIISNAADTPVKKVGQIAQQHQAPQTSKSLDKHAVQVIYFLKDLTQITMKLSDVASIDLKAVHETNVEDLKTIRKAVLSK